GELLDPVLVPRTPGSAGSKAVRDHIKGVFSSLDAWNIEEDVFTTSTPIGDVEFHNLIFSKDPPWVVNPSRITLVAHYDSKRNPEGFIGAIDSAVPVAILLNVARNLDAAMKKALELIRHGAYRVVRNSDDLGIQIIFLDGEEAMLEWTNTDSIYGAKHLADKWHSEQVRPHSVTSGNKLSTIDLFVLLDLIGAANTAIGNYYQRSNWAYHRLAVIEQRLRNKKKLMTSSAIFDDTTGSKAYLAGLIGDDHLPFVAKGVDVLHLIPNRFPRQWHTLKDDKEHLDPDSVHDWSMIFNAFTAEY
ncbi:hypothetical protein CANCADRAFT_18528, partial [Tortispora caseinolytica NRRL Y-17796]